MLEHRIVDLLRGKVATGQPVTVEGWVRTRRDSKAGLSFLHVSDGSCVDPIQVVAPATLPNYESAVAKLSAGCAVRVRGPSTPAARTRVDRSRSSRYTKKRSSKPPSRSNTSRRIA